ncbi:MAG: hypothetical protein IKR23_00205 [Lachnospiraceae bacterium]|nr:hypothetical protein [Lachnospiraceae bacterium]
MDKKTGIKEELQKYSKAVDRMYWIFLVLILLYELLGSTPFLAYFASWMSGGMGNISPELAGLIYQSLMNLRFLIIIPAIYNIAVETKNNRERIILSAMLLLGWFYAFYMREQNDTYIFRDMAMIVASYGKDYRKIAKYSMWLAGGVMAFTVFMNLVGVIPEYNLERDGVIRHSFGTLGPTNLAGHVCFVIVTYVFVKNGDLKWPAYLIILALTVLNLIYVDGRTAFLSVFLVCAGALIYTLFRKKGWTVPEKLLKPWRYLLLASYLIVIAVFMIWVATYSEDPEVFYNKYHVLYSLAGRIQNPNRILGVTGLTLFGKYYDHYWLSGNVFKNTGEYEFLDSSYARVLIMYGLVAFILIVLLLLWTQYRLFKNKHTFRMYVLAVLSLHFMMEHHLLEPAYNIFLLLPFASLDNLQTDPVKAAADKDKKKKTKKAENKEQ